MALPIGDLTVIRNGAVRVDPGTLVRAIVPSS